MTFINSSQEHLGGIPGNQKRKPDDDDDDDDIETHKCSIKLGDLKHTYLGYSLSSV